MDMLDKYEVRRELGGRIRKLRKEQGLSMRGFALAAGINNGYLCKIENGERNVNLDFLVRVANALGVSIYDLFRPEQDGGGSQK